ncbi:MAG: hypothetical protein JRC90_10625 [Deltaproteobacteria bacterium]|nr:hypothetical protein [Deltaproteobacteria bacterium]
MRRKTKKIVKQFFATDYNRVGLKYGLSTGSTMLNLACSDNPSYGFIKGGYYLIVGDSKSGKTWLSLSCMAEAARNSRFANYRFIHENGEGGAMMNLEKFFGEKMASRIEPPEIDKQGNAVHSYFLEDFYYHVNDALQREQPFIYVQDSADVLTSHAEEKKFNEQRLAHRRGKTPAGKMTDGKAAINSQDLRRLLTPLRRTGSILIIINQTRANLGFGYAEKTQSGGKALTFYAGIVMWSSVKGKIIKTIKGKPRQIGTYCDVRIQKNRITGKDRRVIVPIYWSCGIDDIGACVDFLVDENHWTKPKGSNIITAPDLDLKGKRESLIRIIEHRGLERDVRETVAEVWGEIESACKIKRKPRYA